MANDNKALVNAKIQKFDEYFTEYQAVSDELGHYRNSFKNQTIYCNCDDPKWSNFYRYFHNNFSSLGLKKLITTHYSRTEDASYALIYEGGDDFNLEAGTIVEIVGNANHTNESVFYKAGDFRSDACIEFLKESSIVVTNPPFSLFREYVGQLLDYNKQFIIIGNMTAISNRNFFPFIKDNKVWTGYKKFSGGMDMIVPPMVFDKDKVKKYTVDDDGNYIVNVMGVIWYTNIDTSKRHNGLWHINGVFDNSQAHKYYEGNEAHYPYYDNYDAIEVSNVKDIPIDFDGIMGVPITFMDKFNPNEFELLGCSQRDCHDLVPDTKKYDDYWEMKQDGTKTGSSGNKTNENPNLAKNDGKHNYFINAEGHIVQSAYSRLFIRNLHPIKKSDDLGY